MATVMLGMSDDEFWRSTPRKLYAMIQVHKQANGLEEEEDKVVPIDQVEGG
ncbi:hypothetical protein [Tuberibacillus sp. Marseille-P3662]|uniref:hypothetical protein n=1 Tax=Tuberibacillus sp. Marseille-P3662 TaxID=1965358 RepID=UPI00111C2186